MPLVRPLLLSLCAVLVTSGAALAQSERVPWQLGMVPAYSPTMERLSGLHDLLVWLCVLISLFVLVLLGYACFRFRASRNPAPSRRTHNTVLEIAWTAIPVLILVVIAIPSFKLLYYMDTAENPEMTIKAIGRQWYWSYEYPDHGNFTFDAYMIPDADLEEGQPRLLATDNHVVVPAETNIRLLTTASDVLHSWAMPVAGVKMDAIPGLINETWFRIDEPGIYYGQCSELCGAYHGFMPITLEVLPKDEFDAWAKQAQEQFAKVGDAGFAVARAVSE